MAAKCSRNSNCLKLQLATFMWDQYTGGPTVEAEPRFCHFTGENIPNIMLSRVMVLPKCFSLDKLALTLQIKTHRSTMVGE